MKIIKYPELDDIAYLKIGHKRPKKRLPEGWYIVKWIPTNEDTK